MTAKRIPTALSIAGSDSGGGAGIQADLKAFARCGVHGTTAITAITAQNTRAVERVEAVSPQMVFGQILAIAEDMGADAVKIGMLGSPEAIDAVAVGLTYSGSRSGGDRPGDGRRERRGPDRRGDEGGSRRACCFREPRSSRPTSPRPAADRAGKGSESGGAGARERCSAAGTGGGRRHRRPQRGAGRPLLRRRATGRDPRRAPPGRRRPRLRLHPLLGAGGVSGPWQEPLEAARRRARSPRRRSATACARSAPGPGPVDVFGLARLERCAVDFRHEHQRR